jgi:hypothetical protein
MQTFLAALMLTVGVCVWIAISLYAATFGVHQDGDFSEQRFRDIVNAYLANSIGNLLNRTLGLLKKNCSGQLPASADDVPADNPLRAVAEAEVSHSQSAERSSLMTQMLGGRGVLVLQELPHAFARRPMWR